MCENACLCANTQELEENGASRDKVQNSVWGKVITRIIEADSPVWQDVHNQLPTTCEMDTLRKVEPFV